MTREEAAKMIKDDIRLHHDALSGKYRHALNLAITALQQPEPCEDAVNRQAAIDAIMSQPPEPHYPSWYAEQIEALPSAQPERKWTSCSNPPKHHKDVIVRGIEAIGNVTVHKVMQWDVDTWRPTDYAPSVMWKEWSEI